MTWLQRLFPLGSPEPQLDRRAEALAALARMERRRPGHRPWADVLADQEAAQLGVSLDGHLLTREELDRIRPEETEHTHEPTELWPGGPYELPEELEP
jgi:hypothetical protein